MKIDKIKGLRRSHIHQILAYIEDVEIEGWYYGNREYFMKRHVEIKETFEKILNAYRSV